MTRTHILHLSTDGLTAVEIGGTCCTLDPTRPDDRMFIYANYGLPQSVIQGAAMPDTHVVDRKTLEPIMDIMGSKKMQMTKGPGGIAEMGVPCEMQKRFCLLPNQVRAIARLGKAVEAGVGKPVDIEWAYANATLYLVGTR